MNTAATPPSPFSTPFGRVGRSDQSIRGATWRGKEDLTLDSEPAAFTRALEQMANENFDGG